MHHLWLELGFRVGGSAPALIGRRMRKTVSVDAFEKKERKKKRDEPGTKKRHSSSCVSFARRDDANPERTPTDSGDPDAGARNHSDRCATARIARVVACSPVERRAGCTFKLQSLLSREGGHALVDWQDWAHWHYVTGYNMPVKGLEEGCSRSC